MQILLWNWKTWQYLNTLRESLIRNNTYRGVSIYYDDREIYGIFENLANIY